MQNEVNYLKLIATKSVVDENRPAFGLFVRPLVLYDSTATEARNA